MNDHENSTNNTGFNMWESVQPPLEQNHDVAEIPQQQTAIPQTVITQGSRIPKNQTVQQPQNFQQAIPVQPIQTNTSPTQMNITPTVPTQPIQQQNSTVDNLTLLINKQNYTTTEWEKREEIYVQECNKLVFDANNVTGNFIAVMAAKIDALLTPLRVDHIRMQQAVSRYENLIKIKEKLYFSTIKNGTSVKLTVDEIKSLITDKIDNDRSYEEGINLYDAVVRYTSRVTATKGFIDALQDKKDALILYSAILKVENTTNNFTSNVPSQSQFNQMRN